MAGNVASREIGSSDSDQEASAVNKPRGGSGSLAVVIPAYNAAAELETSLAALRLGSLQPDECMVIDDGSTDATVEVAQRYGATVISSGGRRGPAYARNLGAAHCKSSVFLFLDADVCVHRDTLERVMSTFEDPTVDAVIGSYDDSPACPRFISRYRNLMHCFTHQSASKNATTFWSGCGAVRRKAFLDAGGFDATYGRPAVEDIELGYRLFAAGCHMTLDPGIQVQHLKSWDIASMVRTDVRDRAIPWTFLILRAGRMPNDLNVKWTQRLSVFIIGVCLLIAATATVMHGGRFLRPLAASILLTMGSFWVSEIALHKSRMVTAALALSLTTLLALELQTNQFPKQTLAVVLGYAMLFSRDLLCPARGTGRDMLGALYGGYVSAGICWLILQMPQRPFLLILCILATVVIALNFRFYRFLGTHFGKAYGLAAIPFHILYQIYSGLAFAFGTVYYHLVLRRRPSSFPGSNK